jgi:hypothetical protein
VDFKVLKKTHLIITLVLGIGAGVSFFPNISLGLSDWLMGLFVGSFLVTINLFVMGALFERIFKSEGAKRVLLLLGLVAKTGFFALLVIAALWFKVAKPLPLIFGLSSIFLTPLVLVFNLSAEERN